ncbi:SUMO-specific isopeptidase USPL1 [Discoglossus pictus]
MNKDTDMETSQISEVAIVKETGNLNLETAQLPDYEFIEPVLPVREKVCDISFSSDLLKDVQPRHQVNEDTVGETSQGRDISIVKDNSNINLAEAQESDSMFLESCHPVQGNPEKLCDDSHSAGLLKDHLFQSDKHMDQDTVMESSKSSEVSAVVVDNNVSLVATQLPSCALTEPIFPVQDNIEKVCADSLLNQELPDTHPEVENNTMSSNDDVTLKDSSNVSVTTDLLPDCAFIEPLPEQDSPDKECNTSLSSHMLPESHPEHKVQGNALMGLTTSSYGEDAVVMETTPLSNCAVLEQLPLVQDSQEKECVSRSIQMLPNTPLKDKTLMEQSSPLRSKAVVQDGNHDNQAAASLPECKSSEQSALLQFGLNEQCGRVQQTEMETKITSPKLLQNSPDIIKPVSTLPEEHLKIENIVTNQPEAVATIKEKSLQPVPDAAKASPALTKAVQKKHLQWKNQYSLCWLDCIMSALVHSPTLKSDLGKESTDENATVHQLLIKYNEANALMLEKGKGGIPKRLALAETLLKEIRLDIFNKLKPLLKCNLGDHESPVFAFPLLLLQDPEVEKLFVHTYLWKFACNQCGYQHQERCEKTLSTFTNLTQEWHPLNATHIAPCNSCHNSSQKRTMALEKINPIFMLHFVEGLPHNTLKFYSFLFDGHMYKISTIIQYSRKHFSTWISKENGTWLESDDLHGSYSKLRKMFNVHPKDIHIVIWERDPSYIIEESNCTLVPESKAPNVTSQSFLDPDQNTDLPDLNKLSTETTLNSTSASVIPNNSNLLSGLEGYADDDVITLTLVEIPVDSQGNPLENNVVMPEPIYVPNGQVEADIQVANPSESFPENAQFEVPNNAILVPAPGDENPSSDSTSTLNMPHFNKSLSPVEKENCKTDSNTCMSFNITANHSSTPLNNTKKAVVGSWMKSLLNKNPNFITSNLCNSNKKNLTNPPKSSCLLKTTDQHVIAKKAENFGGFKVKGVQKTSHTVATSKIENSSSLGATLQKNNIAPPPGSFLAPTNPLKRGRNGIDYSKFLTKNDSLTSEDKVRRLRLKLLKKLKAKKNELASLEMLAKSQNNENNRGDHPKQAAELNSTNKRDCLRGFLQELQEHIDSVDNESVCTSTSICSSPGDAEFFADLFSPAPTDPPKYGNDDSRFLEMLVDGYDSSFSSYATNDTPSSDTQHVHSSHPDTPHLQPTPENTSCLNTSSSSSTGEENVSEFLSSSALQFISEHEECFPPYDDIF